jgi:hypothetical protein
MPILGVIASSRLAAPANGYISLASYTATGGETSIVFNSINQSYQHLEIRWVGRNGGGGGSYNDVFTQVNGVTSANYSDIYQGGVGGTLAANGGSVSRTSFRAGVAPQNGQPAGLFGCGIMRIPNYTSTTIYKTARAESTWSAPGQTGAIFQFGGTLWSTTNAVTQLSFIPADGSWIAGSSFALYGIK